MQNNNIKERPVNQTSIFLPVMALVGWTFVVLLLIPYHRFKAAFAGRVSTHDFRYGESADVPATVSVPNRVFMNLLEVPVLFYVLCIVSYITQFVTPALVLFAWIYFGLRVLHSLVYLTYNNVIHRFLAFAASNVALVIMWIRLLQEFSQ